MTAAENAVDIEALVAAHRPERDSLIPILQDVQQKYGYLSEGAVTELARLMRVSANEIYGVATFYTRFRFKPPGEHTIRVCLGTACHVRGGRQVLGEFESQLGIKVGQTTDDGKFELERVYCLGCCALAPVGVVDDKVNARMAPKKVRHLLTGYGKRDCGEDAQTR